MITAILLTLKYSVLIKAIATIVDTIDGGQSNEDFTLEIETSECSLMNNENISLTIEKNIMRSCSPPIS